MTVPGRRRAPTQAEVARLAGVSQATVSAVVTGRSSDHRIPAQTASRVMDVVRELGYLANPSARSLKGKRNRLLGVHTFESVFPISQRDFYHEFLIGVEEQAVAEGYDLVLFTSTETSNGQRAVFRDGVNRLKVADGSVLLGIAHDSSDLARLATDGYPFVHVGRRSVPGVEFPWVGADYRTATAQIVARLIELGHRRVGYLGYHGRMEAVIDREDGYRSACATAGIPQLPLFGRAGDLTTEWFDLAIANGMTAFVAEEEPYAERLGEFARLRGLSIPEDLSVVVLRGVSGGPRDRSWSALGVPRNEMGRRAVRLLVEILTEPDVPREHQLLLPCARPSGATIAQPRGGAA